ncbi:MAG: type II toxin-antitoxin system prevent-host-death family antitoxin [Gaiellales bacterium]
MTETLNVSEAKRRFSELIDRVGRGEQFVIARRGKPVVALVSPTRIAQEVERPGGVLSLVGLFADWDGFDEVMDDVVKSRARAGRRGAPRFE